MVAEAGVEGGCSAWVCFWEGAARVFAEEGAVG